jgi:hypothetical protein
MEPRRGFLAYPCGLAIEADGNILIADGSARAVVRVDPVTGVRTTLTPVAPFGDPFGIAVVPAAATGAPPVSVAAGGACGASERDGSSTLLLADDGAPEALALSVTSSNEALVPSADVTFAGTGALRTMSVAAVNSAIMIESDVRQ